MGESIVEAPTVDKKMDESVKSGGGLDVSVSFGRFENDALAWEKWSSFSPNKYLEEVGTLSTPGSVAQKKAYFEAHYKKIAAAKKTEELELENPTNSIISTPVKSCSENSSGIDATMGLSNGEENTDTASMLDLTNLTINDEVKEDNARVQGVEQFSCANGLMGLIVLEEKVDDAVALKFGSLMPEEAKDELNIDVVDSKLDVRNEPVLVGVEIPCADDLLIVEKVLERKNGMELSCLSEKDNSKLKNAAQKVTPTRKERNLDGTSKKSASLVVKSSKASTPRYSKPTSSSTPTIASQSSKKKINKSPLPNSKIATPTSLHMSLSLGPTNSSVIVPITRKSLIMEKMGDKDIVRRAFKSFQNFASGSPADEISSKLNLVRSTALKSKVSTSPSPRKDSEGLKKDAVEVTAQRTRSVARTKPGRTKPSPSRSEKSSSKNTMTVSTSTGLRSDERAEKRKEFIKNLEAKSIAREAEKAQRSAKSKDEKDSEFKKLKESLIFKAKPLPSFYQNQEKHHLEKESANNGVRH